MKYLVIVTAILFFFILLAVSWHLKVLFLFLIFYLWKRELPKSIVNNKVVVLGINIVFALAFIVAFPNRISDKTDYIQSVYFNVKTGKEVSMPILPYLTNIIGEGDIMTGVSLFSKIIPVDNIRMRKPAKDAINYSRNISFLDDNFHVPYRKLERKESPPHNVPFQILKGKGFYKDIEHYFLHIPKGVNLNDCKIIVFAHGYTGSWLLLNELFAEYTNAIIIAVETPNFSGTFTKDIMKNINEVIIPHAYKRIGILVMDNKPNLIGLSNGGSAINTAIMSCSNYYKTFTILSAKLNHIPGIITDVNLIYGSNDLSGGVKDYISPDRYRSYIVEGEDHSLTVKEPKLVFNYIKKIIK